MLIAALSDVRTLFWPTLFDGLSLGAVYALVALGYTMVYGVLRLINFAHSEIFMIGTFATITVMNQLGYGIGDPIPSGAEFVLFLSVATLFAMACSGGAAVLLERLAYRPLRRRGASRLAALIAAIGASLFLVELFAAWKGRDSLGSGRVLNKDPLFTIGGAAITTDRLLTFFGALLMMGLLLFVVNKTRIGRGIRAVAQDAETASLMGVNIDRIVMITFLLGGMMAGVAGLLFVIRFENTKFNIGFVLGVKAFTAAVLGGIGNVAGALAGGFALGVMESYGAVIFGAQWKDVVAFVILVGVLIFKPTGILGESLTKARA